MSALDGLETPSSLWWRLYRRMYYCLIWKEEAISINISCKAVRVLRWKARFLPSCRARKLSRVADCHHQLWHRLEASVGYQIDCHSLGSPKYARRAGEPQAPPTIVPSCWSSVLSGYLNREPWQFSSCPQCSLEVPVYQTESQKTLLKNCTFKKLHKKSN